MLSVREAETRAREIGLRPSFARLNVFRVLLKHPHLAQRVVGLLTKLLFEDVALEPRLRELAIMRIAWMTGSEYEWAQHWRFCISVGLAESEVTAIRNWQDSQLFDSSDRAVLAAVDETVRRGCIADDTWSQCAKALGSEAALIELVLAIGNWMMFSQLLRSLKIPLESEMQSWPPDGEAATYFAEDRGKA